MTQRSPLIPNHLLTMKPSVHLPPTGKFVKEDVYGVRGKKNIWRTLPSGSTCTTRTRTLRLPLYPGPGRGVNRFSRDAQTSLSQDPSSSSSGVSPRRSQACRET
ncbi:hypothetical protein XENORESO_020186 [Xenotaenia resolanae]|uniref:Uncharacterized protein n=1 Tax=Xenotaenia resolanae TaxID=208358 RepID=A0ABV0VTJ6_9TELE